MNSSLQLALVQLILPPRLDSHLLLNQQQHSTHLHLAQLQVPLYLVRILNQPQLDCLVLPTRAQHLVSSLLRQGLVWCSLSFTFISKSKSFFTQSNMTVITLQAFHQLHPLACLDNNHSKPLHRPLVVYLAQAPLVRLVSQNPLSALELKALLLPYLASHKLNKPRQHLSLANHPPKVQTFFLPLQVLSYFSFKDTGQMLWVLDLPLMYFTFSLGGFRSTAPQGTIIKPYQPTVGTDSIVKHGNTHQVSTRHCCISTMKEYENKSLEELRYEDYLANRKGRQQGAGVFGQTQPTASPFGTPSTSTATGGLFGSTTENKSLFGQPSTSIGESLCTD